MYHATEEFGLDSTVPCGGYFLMAEVFRRQEKKQVARSLYSQVRGYIGLIHLVAILEMNQEFSPQFQDGS